MSRHAQSERQALCDVLLDVGPDAATLCHGWQARDLAAHLVIREHRPDAQLGMFVPRLAGRTETVQAEVAAADWPVLVGRVRSGPPTWHPTRIGAVDETVNTAEFFVHHEDVLRARPGWTARDLPADLQGALWRVARTIGRLSLRRAPVGVELVAPGHGRSTARKGQPPRRRGRAPGRPGPGRGAAAGHRPGPLTHLDQWRVVATGRRTG
jgi:uncharacterized protein (TIGR03085 family)